MKILYTLTLNEKCVDYLSSVGEVTYIERKNIKKEDVEDQEIIIGNIPIEFIKYCKNLKYLQLESAGSDGYKDIDASILLCNASGTFGKTISEHVIMVILMLQRNMMEYMNMQKEHAFYRLGNEEMLYHKNVLILGCGDLGCEIAKRLKAFDTTVIGLKRNKVDAIPYFDEVYTMESFEQKIALADIIICCLPKNEESNLLFDKKHLEMLKNNCLFINVGRGNVVDEDALFDCLENNQIKGAALDVFSEEPLNKDNKLYTCKNLIITPHVSGTFACQKTKDIFCDIVIDNVSRYLNHEELYNQVNRKTGYRVMKHRIQK